MSSRRQHTLRPIRNQKFFRVPFTAPYVYFTFSTLRKTMLVTLYLVTDAFISAPTTKKFNQAPLLSALADSEIMICSTSLRMTSAFDLPTSSTSSCDTVGVGGRSNATPAS